MATPIHIFWFRRDLRWEDNAGLYHALYQAKLQGKQVLPIFVFDKTIRIWNVKTGETTQILSEHTAPVLSLSFSPKDATLVSGSADRSVMLWQLLY
jgi:deoxyribodipyrimidine photolyase